MLVEKKIEKLKESPSENEASSSNQSGKASREVYEEQAFDDVYTDSEQDSSNSVESDPESDTSMEEESQGNGEEDEAFSDDFEEDQEEKDSVGSGEESVDEAFDEELDSEEEEGPSTTKEMIKGFSSLDLENQKKAELIVAQQEVAEQLVEIRVLMEDMVSACNQLPQHTTSVEDQDTLDLFQEAHGTINNELMLFSSLQRDLLKWNPDTAYVLKGEKSPAADDQTEETEKLPKGKRKLEDTSVSAILAKRHKLYRTYRDEVIDKYDKYAVAKADKKSFVSFEEPLTKTIERALADMPNLVKRTQLPRTNIKVVGKAEAKVEPVAATEGKTDEELMAESSQPQAHDPEIFDDNDFYHLLLRCHQDLLASKSKNSHAFKNCQEVLERLRKKLKKKVDTRASKGRKIRYNVHQKLVHYLRPVPPHADLDRIRNSVYKVMFRIPH